MKKIISIQLADQQLNLPPLEEVNSTLLRKKLQERWPNFLDKISTNKVTQATTPLNQSSNTVVSAYAEQDGEDGQDGPFVDVDQGPDFIDVHPGEDGGGGGEGDEGGDGGDGGGQDRLAG
ncbi:hypothetical protein [Paraburkholderia oxyphila]|uniref:hypothetical protein n=1 Tax=Paraburkholderia oxyphila TaxID=614212 RepID=UPI0012ECD1D8|nr:hypothetical protein [Paraburkholderia oxyphila]